MSEAQPESSGFDRGEKKKTKTDLLFALGSVQVFESKKRKKKEMAQTI
jgi:hypothetical protein